MIISDAMTLAEVRDLFEEPNAETTMMNANFEPSRSSSAMIIYKGDRDVDEELEIENLAKNEGLITLVSEVKGNYEDPERTEKYRFLLKSEDSWRVPAYIEFMQMMKTHYRWCDGAEHFERLLLGFEEHNIIDYLVDRKNTHGFWGLQLVYVIMHRDYFLKLDQLGHKCFERLNEAESISLIFDSLHRRLKTSVHSHTHQNYVIGRFGLAISSLREIFDLSELRDNFTILTVKVENARIPFLNQALRTKVQFFSDGSWR